MRTRLALLVVPLALASCRLLAPPNESHVARVLPPAFDEVEDAEAVRLGRALFTHTWTPNDPLSVAGNGLGPVFNARSCVACHSQGGVGGAGGLDHQRVVLIDGEMSHKFGEEAKLQPAEPRTPGVGGGGLGAPRSVGLSEPGGRTLFKRLAIAGLGLVGTGGSGGFRVPTVGRRDATALFGAGAIDALPVDAIDRGARERDPRFPEIGGELSRTADGLVGRFGWKGDVDSLATFVTNACAVEVGLTVPGAPEAASATEDQAPGLDLDGWDVHALTRYLASLPRPVERDDGELAERGRAIADEIGCLSCHRPSLGDVDGLYSDLLLHDMGDQLADTAGYYGEPPPEGLAKMWRTPPLWGVRDSGPWLHDGRASSLADAVARHDGEASKTRDRYRELAPMERDAVIAFLESLVAPGAI